MNSKHASIVISAAVMAGLANVAVFAQVPGAPAAPAEPPSPPTTQTSADLIERRIEAQARELAARQRTFEAQQRAMQVQGRGGATGIAEDPFVFVDAPMGIPGQPGAQSLNSPALIVTEPLSDADRTAWTEDLKVMDKLLREAVSAGGGGGAGSGMIAMGIQVSPLSFDRNEPVYLEGAGVLLSTKTNIALATSGSPTTSPGVEREVESAWERARRELKGPSDSPRFRRTPALPVFDQAKLDRLIASIATLLPEATNIRQLKDDEFVYITVIGIDDAGVSQRLNFKASKSDIDQAASGAISPETFRQRVASNID